MKKNEVVLTEKEIADGVDKINHALLLVGLRCNEGDVGYETVYTDHSGETQGGWYAQFDKKSRDKLRQSKQVSWRNTGMIGGDTLDEILSVIASLKFRNYAKEPSTTQVKKVANTMTKESATKKALEIFNSALPMSDNDLKLCIDHFCTLDALIKVDPMLHLARPYVTMNLQVLEGYKEARKRN